MNQIAANLEHVRAQLAAAAHSAGRDPSEVRLLAVTKTFPVDVVREAVKAGQMLFGENRVQEAQLKIPELQDKNLEWHLIGHLQSNKARAAVELFDVIETIDSEKIARRVDRICGELDRRMPVLIEVNIGEEPQKEGVAPAQVKALARLIDGLPQLELRGLMALPPFSDDPEHSRPYFRRLADLLKELNDGRPCPLTELSMGMSSDFVVAIEEGATLVRVGTSIFGERG